MKKIQFYAGSMCTPRPPLKHTHHRNSKSTLPPTPPPTMEFCATPYFALSLERGGEVFPLCMYLPMYSLPMLELDKTIWLDNAMCLVPPVSGHSSNGPISSIVSVSTWQAQNF